MVPRVPSVSSLAGAPAVTGTRVSGASTVFSGSVRRSPGSGSGSTSLAAGSGAATPRSGGAASPTARRSRSTSLGAVDSMAASSETSISSVSATSWSRRAPRGRGSGPAAGSRCHTRTATRTSEGSYSGASLVYTRASVRKRACEMSSSVRRLPSITGRVASTVITPGGTTHSTRCQPLPNSKGALTMLSSTTQSAKTPSATPKVPTGSGMGSRKS